jgi:hypothetical protein
LKRDFFFITRKMIFVVMISFLSLLLIQSSQASEFDDLFILYEIKEAGESEGLKLHERLLKQAPEGIPQYEMWKSLFSENLSDEEKASIALKLVDDIFPEGDPSQWDAVEGLWIPQLMPKPLAALDGLYMAMQSLLSMDEEGAPWLARDLFLRLYKSRGARFYGIRTVPIEVLDILEKLKARAPLPPIGGWPNPQIIGRLPFARKIYGCISVDTALMYNMTFLDSYGRPRGGAGVFAWDRARGRIFHVRSGPSRDEIWPKF